MFALCASLYSWRRGARFATLITIFSVFWLASAYAQTQDSTSTQSASSPQVAVPQQAPPYAEFQSSTLTGSGNTINTTTLPVVTTNGTVYYDVVIQFDVATDGTLTVSAGYPQIVQSHIPLANHFKAGTYLGPDSSSELIVVNGPGVAAGGSTIWTLGPSSNAGGCMFPNTATWYVVSALSASPLAARLKAAGITNTKLSYGTGSGGGCANGRWGTNSLLGFDQTGGAITITSFTNGGTDYNVPQDTKTYQFQ